MTVLSIFLIIVALGLIAESWWDHRIIKKLTRRLDYLEHQEHETRSEPKDFRTWGPEHKKVEGETYDPPAVDVKKECDLHG